MEQHIDVGAACHPIHVVRRLLGCGICWILTKWHWLTFILHCILEYYIFRMCLADYISLYWPNASWIQNAPSKRSCLFTSLVMNGGSHLFSAQQLQAAGPAYSNSYSLQLVCIRVHTRSWYISPAAHGFMNIISWCAVLFWNICVLNVAIIYDLWRNGMNE